MLTLALESSAKAASAALVEDDVLLAQYSQCCALTHSRTLLPMVEDMLKNTDRSLSDVDLFAVAHGPGSFTGIRIGIATVKGLSWALEKPCVGVSTLEAMAWHGVACGTLLCPVMDARRSQVYNALFQVISGKPVRLTEDRALSLEDLAAEVKEYDSEFFLIGDGAKVTSDYFSAAGISCHMAPQNLVMQSAWGVAKAADGKEPGTADALLPVYLRLSQAERERQEWLAAKAAADLHS